MKNKQNSSNVPLLEAVIACKQFIAGVLSILLVFTSVTPSLAGPGGFGRKRVRRTIKVFTDGASVLPKGKGLRETTASRMTRLMLSNGARPGYGVRTSTTEPSSTVVRASQLHQVPEVPFAVSHQRGPVTLSGTESTADQMLVKSYEKMKGLLEAGTPEAEAEFTQQLKKEQKWIENARANGWFDYCWSKVEIADVVYNDTDKLARMVKAFYFYYIDPKLKVFPRAKYLKTNEAGRIYEIPLKKGLFLEVPGPLNLIPITSEEYVVFKADGENENPHLVKRADVEFLTDPLSYKFNL